MLFIGFRIAATLLFVVLLILLAMSWDKAAAQAERILSRHISPAGQRILFIIVTVLLEAGAVYMLAGAIHWSWVDTLFFGSFLFLAFIWFVQMNQASIRNNAVAFGRFYGTKEEATHIQPFRLSRHPLVIGTMLFSLCGFIITIVYYLPYFL